MKRFITLLLAVVLLVSVLSLTSCKRRHHDDFEEVPDVKETENEGFVTSPVTDVSERLENAPPEDDYGWGKIQ